MRNKKIISKEISDKANLVKKRGCKNKKKFIQEQINLMNELLECKNLTIKERFTTKRGLQFLKQMEKML